jgi:hypothetical protein
MPRAVPPNSFPHYFNNFLYVTKSTNVGSIHIWSSNGGREHQTEKNAKQEESLGRETKIQMYFAQV